MAMSTPEPTGREPFPQRVGRLVRDFWFVPVRAERLVLFQRAFTLTFLAFLIAWGSSATEWLTDEGFHFSAEATRQAYPAPFPALPRAWLPGFLVLLFGTTTLVILDSWGRAPKILLCALSIYVQMVDQPSSFTLNNIYVMFFFFLAVAPAPVTARDGSRWIPAWPIRLIQTTLLIQYGTAGLCKSLHGDWLFQSDVLFTHSVGVYRTPIAALVVEYAPMALWAVFAWQALLFELTAPLMLTLRRLRLGAVLWGSSFHIGVALLMKNLIFFSLQMMSVYVLFLGDEGVVRTERAIARRLDDLLRPIRRRARRLRA